MMKKFTKKLSCFFALILLITAILPLQDTRANSSRKVKVAFFPMTGYNERLSTGERTGMNVEYLQHLSSYVDWEIEYVDCENWDDALNKLKNRQVDLVGSAQYSKERAETFDYAELASGYTFGAVAVNEDNLVAYEDFHTFRNLTFGMVETYVRKEEFYSYFKQNGISNPRVKEYKTTEELQNALDKGQVDAMVHSLTEIEDNQRIVARFAPRSFYYITYKGNDKFLEELDRAISELNLSEPEFSSSLMKKYYISKRDGKVAFSHEEKAYIENKKELKIGYRDGFYPFSYEEDGEYMGLARKALETVEETAGLSMSYVKMDTSEAAGIALKNGDIDVLCYCSFTDENIEENNFIVSKSYSGSPVVLVAARGNSRGEAESVAIVPDMRKEAEDAIGVSGINLLELQSQEDCLDAVVKGEADAAVCDGFLAEYLLGKDVSYSNLRIESVLNFDHEIRMVMSQEAPEELISVIRKSLPEITDKQVSEYIISSNTFLLLSIDEFVRAHSFTIILILMVMTAIGISIGIHQYRTSKKIQRLMYKDYNMDVWNVNYLTFKANEILSGYNNKDRYSVVTVCISQFRYYVTLFGRKGGEYLLKSMAEEISDHVNSKEIFARSQTDRFVIFINCTDRDEFDVKLAEIKTAIETRLYHETDTRMTVLMGAYLLPEDDKNVEDAIANSNMALEAAGEGKGEEIIFYDENLAKELKEMHEREQLLKSVSIEDNFVTYYQAKVDIRTEEIVGAEALVRFKDPTAGGTIRAPYYFVPYYEKTGKITEIDFFVLESVCKMIRRRLDRGEKVVPISCNFSRHHFMRLGFTEKFQEILNRYNIPKELVEVEITETLIMEELQRQLVKKNIDELTAEGIHLSIDDFGSGYSSLGVFEQIPASVIKLDRSFLLNQEDRNRQIAIMRGIVHMATDLNAQVVCEGVENDEDVALMREIDAHVAQGYKYSKPIPEEEFEEKFLATV